MITHEEAREVLVTNMKLVWNKTEFANDYIAQQEKISKLLELYQYLWKKPVIYQEYSLEQIQKMIDKIEEELK